MNNWWQSLLWNTISSKLAVLFYMQNAHPSGIAKIRCGYCALNMCTLYTLVNIVSSFWKDCRLLRMNYEAWSCKHFHATTIEYLFVFKLFRKQRVGQTRLSWKFVQYQDSLFVRLWLVCLYTYTPVQFPYVCILACKLNAIQYLILVFWIFNTKIHYSFAFNLYTYIYMYIRPTNESW